MKYAVPIVVFVIIVLSLAFEFAAPCSWHRYENARDQPVRCLEDR